MERWVEETLHDGFRVRLKVDKVLFDSQKVQITNVPQANQYLTREYRKGWEL